MTDPWANQPDIHPFAEYTRATNHGGSMSDRDAWVSDIQHELMLDHGCILHNPREAKACRTCKRRAELIYDKVIDRDTTGCTAEAYRRGAERGWQEGWEAADPFDPTPNPYWKADQ